MAENMFEVYVKLVQMAIITIILIVLIARQRQFRIRQLYWFIAVFALADIQGIIEMVIYYVKTSILHLKQTSLYPFNEFHSIPYSLAIFTLYLLTEFMTRLRPHYARISIITGLWAAYLSLMVYDAMFTVEPGSPGEHLFNSVFNVFQCSAMLFVTYVFYKAFRLAKNPENKRVSFLVFIAVAMFETVAVYEILQEIFPSILPRFYNAIPYSLTFFIIAYVYLRFPYYVFNVPTRIYRVFIVDDRNGLLLYSAEIENPGELGDNIFAPAITTVSSLMKEATGTAGSLQHIKFTDRSLLRSQYGYFAGYIIADNATMILGSALEQFVREFSEKYSEELKGTLPVYATPFRGSKKLIARCFPFLEAKDVIRTRGGTTESGT